MGEFSVVDVSIYEQYGTDVAFLKAAVIKIFGGCVNLILILVGLFAALAIVVKITEKKGKPLDPEQQQRYSKIIMVLVFLTLLGAMFKQCS